MSAPNGRATCLAILASVTDRREGEISLEDRVVEDLGLDSLAVIELIVALTDQPGLESFATQMLEGTWANVTVRSLIEAYDHACTHAAIARAVTAEPRPHSRRPS